jgi:hypothetical protein
MSKGESKYTRMKTRSIVVVGALFFLFSFAMQLSIDKAFSSDVLTDLETQKYYFNPNGHVDNKFDSKGKMFSIPESGSKHVVAVEETQEHNGMKVTLHKVEFSDRNTGVYLTVENNDPSEDMAFYGSNAKAIQGHRLFATTYSLGPAYPKIESTIPPGIAESGVVSFEPLDKTQCEDQFVFDAHKGTDDIKFTFDVVYDLCVYKEASKGFDKALAVNSTDIYALINKGITKIY